MRQLRASAGGGAHCLIECFCCRRSRVCLLPLRRIGFGVGAEIALCVAVFRILKSLVTFVGLIIYWRVRIEGIRMGNSIQLDGWFERLLDHE